MVTTVPTADWRRLMQSALAFFGESPWNCVEDAQVFGVVVPDAGEKIYCSVMGGSGDMRALAMYPGKSGWRSYLEIGEESPQTDPEELLYRQHCLVLSFEPVQDADADDIALLKKIGYDTEKLPTVPSFRSYHPGYLPQTPSQAEVNWLQIVIPQALQFLAELQGADYFLSEDGTDEEGRLCFRVLDAENAEWKSIWLKPDTTIDFSPPSLILEKAEEARGKHLPLVETIWLMEEFHLPEPAYNEMEVAFFPHVFLFFDLEAQAFRGVCMIEPSDFPALVGPLLLELLEQQAMRPSQIVVSKPQNLILMRPFCQALGIGVHLETELDILPALREAVMESVGNLE